MEARVSEKKPVNPITELKKDIEDAFRRAKASKPDVCPSCGHCPTCGRGGHHLAPWVVPMPSPYPWHYYQPYYHNLPYQVTCETATIGLHNGQPAMSGTGNVTNMPQFSISYTGIEHDSTTR